MRKLFALLTFIFAFWGQLHAQKILVTGQLKSSLDSTEINHAKIQAKDQSVFSDEKGYFSIEVSAETKVKLMLDHLAFEDKHLEIKVKDKNIDLEEIFMEIKLLEEAEVAAQLQLAKYVGDTLQYNAAAVQILELEKLNCEDDFGSMNYSCIVKVIR